MSDYASRDLDKVIVRLPNGMRDQLKDAAKTQNRTMNAEIVSRLQFTLDADMALSGGNASNDFDAKKQKWTEAFEKRKALDKRQMSDADLDYIADRLSLRLSSSNLQGCSNILATPRSDEAKK